MDEDIVLIIPGLIFLVAGVGFLFARADDYAKEKDEKRFGRLSPYNLGGWYILMQNRSVRKVFIVFCILLGTFLVFYSLKSLI